MELSKSDKKAARIIIEKGLQQEMANGLAKFEKLLTNWKINKPDNRETYHALYKKVKDFDKNIAWRYDDLRPRFYLPVIAGQLYEGLISQNDLNELSDESQHTIQRLISLQDKT